MLKNKNMKYYELEKEEKAILHDYESGKMKRVKNFAKEKTRYEQYARAALQKNKNINIRLSEHDLFKLKAKALEEGLPYQTYISSILHKYLAAGSESFYSILARTRGAWR